MSALSRNLTLTDGTAVAIRPIAAGDKELLSAFLAALSPESAQRRFLVAKARFSAGELRYLTEIDGNDHVALLAVNASDPSDLIGVGRYVRLRDDPLTADIAIVVADRHQGMRLGSHLGALLAEEARGHGVEHLSATMRADNVPAHRLLAGMSGHLVEGAQGFGVHDMIADLAA
jgi:acetyltransferase